MILIIRNRQVILIQEKETQEPQHQSIKHTSRKVQQALLHIYTNMQLVILAPSTPTNQFQPTSTDQLYPFSLQTINLSTTDQPHPPNPTPFLNRANPNRFPQLTKSPTLAHLLKPTHHLSSVNQPFPNPLYSTNFNHLLSIDLLHPFPQTVPLQYTRFL